MERLNRMVRRVLTHALWWVGERLPHAAREAVSRTFGWVLGWFHVARVPVWEANVEALTGRRPTRADRQQFLTHWMRNNLMSMSLARWSEGDVLRHTRIDEADVAKLHSSLAGPGLVLVLPHMGSWDLAGAWCATQGIGVTSVAERLPDGVFELFTRARCGMGMDILAVDQPGLMRSLADAVRERHAVCLLGDRDLSSRGIAVDLAGLTISMPAGPALLARRTGADLRAVGLHFDGPVVHLSVGDPVTGTSVGAVTQHLADHFARAAAEHPTSWLQLGRLNRA